MSEYIVNLDGELGMALAVACAGAGFVREEIVRCKDCKWRVDRVHNDVTTYKCSFPHGGPSMYFPVESDDFCCWGKRKVVD